MLCFVIRICIGRSRKILHSSRFDRISESDLDIVLESIKEESREGSVSPMGSRETVMASSELPPFKWEPMLPPNLANEKLMEQLMSKCSHNTSPTLSINNSSTFGSSPIDSKKYIIITVCV